MHTDELTITSPVREHAPGLFARGLAGGLVAAIAGAVVWAVIVKTTEHEIGFVAWVIGTAAGIAVLLAAGGAKARRLQVVALTSALFGIVLGKYLAFVLVVKDFVAEAVGREAAAEISYFSVGTIDVFLSDLGAVFSAHDALWVTLAALTAWRILQPGKEGVRSFRLHR